MLKVGIVGLPNVGKSTLFKALTKNPVDINNYPFCTIDPNVGIVNVPDERLLKLSELSKSEKTIPAVIEFVDIAGLVKGANEGEGLGNKFLSHIREVDLICQVVRFFESENIKHVEDRIDPKQDLEIINTELILADLATLEKRKVKTQKIARGQTKESKEAALALLALEKIEKTLNQNEPASKTDLTEEEKEALGDLQLLTQKPFLYVFNISDKNHPALPAMKQELPHLELNIGEEAEMLSLSPEEIKELGLVSNIGELAKTAYQVLGLITFFTTGEKESRAWTVEKGADAPSAGAKIHNDFQEKFIRAEVVNYDDFSAVGSYKAVREKGLLRTEGKDYTVKDGDIIIFKI